MKFRRKPFEAHQYTGTNGHFLKQWSDSRVIESPVLEEAADGQIVPYVQIRNITGWTTAGVGDWIIFEECSGDYLPCSDKAFKAMYEPVFE